MLKFDRVARLMRPLLGVTLATTCFSAVASDQPLVDSSDNTQRSESRVEPRIVGGSEVTTDDRPWMAAILDSSRNDAFSAQFCGGSVIAPNWVMTAAHCLVGERAGGVDVLVGQRNLRGTGGERVRARRLIVHPEYSSSGDRHDIALIELTRPVSVTPVNIAAPGSAIEAPGRLAEVMGWGNLRESGGSSPRLMKVRVPVVSQAVCNRQYGGIDEASMICAGFSDGGRDSCQGDSGGPLFVNAGSDFTQIGIVSFGEGCARPNFAGVYARVSNYFDWVRATAGIDGGEPPPPPPSGDTLEAKFNVRCRPNRVCRFNASATESDSRITSFVWDTGDGNEGSGRVLRHRYAQSGSYPVSLFVTNADGELDEITETVVVGDSNGGSEDNFPKKRTFSGSLSATEARSRVSLPGRGEAGLFVRKGKLQATLNAPSDSVFVMRLRRFDSDQQGWVDVARVRSNNGRATIARRATRGRYQVILVAVNGGGNYQVEVAHQ